MCDELLSEEKATAPKVQSGLQRNGFTVSLSTIYRIARDLWTKPWHTDILTPVQKLKHKTFCAGLLRLPDDVLFRRISRWMFSDEKWWDIIGPACYKYCKAASAVEAKMQNQVYCLPCRVVCHRLLFLLVCLFSQQPRHKSKKGGMKKRVYFWGAISWFGRSPGMAWTAADIKVTFRHTKNLCLGTVFLDDDEEGNPCVYRVIETRAAGNDRNVSYVKHFDFPDHTPPSGPDWFTSTYAEVKEWHDATRAVLAQRDDLQPPSGMQDTSKTLEIYNEALYPTLTRFGINELVEDNASPITTRRSSPVTAVTMCELSGTR